MGGDEKTRLLGETGDLGTTRLVRRDQGVQETVRMPQKPSVDEEPKTQLVRRTRRAGSLDDKDVAEDVEEARCVTGWLVVVNGAGRGRFAPVFDGMNSVGRGEDMTTRVNFGDAMISRSAHAYVTYDYRSRKFYIEHGGKANIVRLNDEPVLAPVELRSGDLILIGATTFRFAAFCGETFDWQD